MLTALTFLPLLGALLVYFVPSANERLLRLVALGTTAVVALLGVILFFGFEGASAAMHTAFPILRALARSVRIGCAPGRTPRCGRPSGRDGPAGKGAASTPAATFVPRWPQRTHDD